MSDQTKVLADSNGWRSSCRYFWFHMYHPRSRVESM